MEQATNSESVKLECCLEGIESAIQAVQGGAHRMELCANLSQGGVTPSIGDIEEAVSAAKGSGTAVHVLIRPRPGDFVYSQREKKVMAKDVAAALKAGAHGVVIGALLENGGIDKEITAELIRVARATAAPCSCSITFHRAFDCCATEATAALETLMRLGVDRVLTSGRAESAWAGRDTITRLVEAGQGRIVVIPGLFEHHLQPQQMKGVRRSSSLIVSAEVRYTMLSLSAGEIFECAVRSTCYDAVDKMIESARCDMANDRWPHTAM